MSPPLADRIALVAGASRGIGAALVSGELVAQRGPLLDQEVHSCDDDRQSN